MGHEWARQSVPPARLTRRPWASLASVLGRGDREAVRVVVPRTEAARGPGTRGRAALTEAWSLLPHVAGDARALDDEDRSGRHVDPALDEAEDRRGSAGLKLRRVNAGVPGALLAALSAQEVGEEAG